MKEPDLEKTQEYINFVKQNLEPLAKEIGTSVEWLWGILVQQARVEAITWLVVVILLTVKSFIFLLIAYKSYKKATFYSPYSTDKWKHKKTGEIVDYYETGDITEYEKVPADKTNLEGHLVYWCTPIGIALMVLSITTATLSLPVIVTGLVNPEYRAIERIVEFAKPQIKEKL